MCRRAGGQPPGLGSPTRMGGTPPSRRGGGSIPGGPGFPGGIGGPRGPNAINFNPNIRIDAGGLINQLLGGLATIMQQMMGMMMEAVRRRNGNGGSTPTPPPPTSGATGTSVQPSVSPPPLPTSDVTGLTPTALDTRFPGLSNVTRLQSLNLGAPQEQLWGEGVRFQNGTVRYNNGQSPSSGYTITVPGASGQPDRSFFVDERGSLVGTTTQSPAQPYDSRYTGQFPRLNDVKRVLNLNDLGTPQEITEGGRRGYRFPNGIRVLQSDPSDTNVAYRIIVPGTGPNRTQETHYKVAPNGLVQTEQVTPVPRPEL